MEAIDWVERVKAATHTESDYGVAKVLGLSRQAMSDIRKGKTRTLGEDSCIKIAEALGERPAAVVLDQAAERVKTPEVRTALLEQARQLCILCSMRVSQIWQGLPGLFPA